ncbi:MAG TPA: lipid II flippase MurJ [Vitreimonas sp.]|nr:lipid II flippase MurJ [Vitreimonas sp.]
MFALINLKNNFLHRVNTEGGLYNLLFHTSLTLTGTSALSYLLGLTRDKVFAYSIGASPDLDIYNAAFVVPDFLFAVFVSGALSAAFVPIFTSFDEKNRHKAILYINEVLSWTLSFLGVFSVLFAIFLPLLTPWLVKGFSPVEQAQYIWVTRLMLMAPFLFTVSNTFGNALLSLKGFLWYGLAPVMYNLGIIVGVVMLYPHIGVAGLVMGTIVGAALHMAIRVPELLQYGFRPRFVMRFSPEMIETFRLMLPKMIQIGMWQVMLWWFVNLATQTGAGGVTQYNFAYNFQSVPVSLIGVAIALAAFADLSHLAAQKKLAAFRTTIIFDTVKIFVITTAAAVTVAMISYPLVNTLLGGGKFTADAVATTAALLSVYAISIPFESMMHLLARAHYALRNTLRPSAIHVVAIMVSLGVSTWLLPTLGLFALPVAFSTGFIVQDLLLGISLWQLLRKPNA